MEHSLREYIEFLDEKNLVIDYHLEEGLPEIKVKNISYNSKDDMYVARPNGGKGYLGIGVKIVV